MRPLLIRTLYHIKISGMVTIYYWNGLQCFHVWCLPDHRDDIHRTGFWIILKCELIGDDKNLLEKAMAPYSSTLAWKIPWTEEPGGLRSMGSLRVRHDWATLLSRFTFMHWRRKWQPTPVFLPGESQGRGSLVGCHLWGCTETDMTEVT